MLFTAVAATSPAEAGSLSGLLAVDEVLASLTDEQLYTLLTRIRDWNTNNRTSSVAQRILSVLLKSYPADKFIELATVRRKKKGPNDMVLKDVLEAVERYTERHYARIEELVGETYLLEYT